MAKEESQPISGEAAAGSVLDGLSQFSNESFDTAAAERKLNDALKSAESAGDRLKQARLREMRHLMQKANDPATQDALRQSYGTLKGQISDSLAYAESQAAKHGGTLSNRQRLNLVAGRLGKLAGFSGSMLSFGQALSDVVQGDGEGVGQDAVSAVLGGLVGTAVTGVATSLGLPVIVSGALVGGASLLVGMAVDEFLPDSWAETIGGPVVDVYDSAVSGLTDFLEWWDPAGIMPDTNSSYLNAYGWVRMRDPLTVDLDGDGLETVGIDTGRPIHFDHDADGVKTASGWVAPDDGFLVLDRNGNGTVDSGAELFGDSTVLADGSEAADGFAALAEQDTNEDGRVDSEDAHWSALRIWRDLNQNGISEADELQSLDEVGIASLDVDAQSHSQALGNGNQIADVGRFTWTSGETGEIESVTGRSGDVDLAENPFYREFADPVTLTEQAIALPAMRGSGSVRDMREAASLSSGFAQTLTDYSQASTRDGQIAQLDGLVKAWARTSNQSSSAELAEDKGYRLIYLVPGMSAGDYENYLPYLEGDMAPPGDMSDEDRAHLAELKAEQKQVTEWISTLERFNGQPFVEVENSGVLFASGRRATVSSGPRIGVRRAYVSISSAQKQMLDRSYEAIRTSVYEGLIKQTRLAPYLESMEWSYDEVAGVFGVDFSALESRLDAANTNDPINALVDLIELTRYAGESLQNTGWDAEGYLRARLDDLAANPELTESLATTLDELGVVTGTGELEGSASRNTLLGGAQADRLDARDGDDWLSGAAGDDRLYGDTGDDLLQGDAGNDRLYGGRGDDVLDGGDGDDRLDGGYGDDTYRFGFGSGQDLIASYDRTSGKQDIVVFDESVTTADVALLRSGNDLLITLGDGTDTLTVRNHFSYDGDDRHSRIEALRFDSGAVWDVGDIRQAVLMSGDATETLIGYETDDVIDAGDGNDHVYGHEGNDTLSGGAGNDELRGDEGDDTLIGGAGVDYVFGGDGDDELFGGVGDDYLRGGEGSDLFHFGVGSGSDRINSQYHQSTDKTDAVLFDAEVDPADVAVRRSASNLVLSLANGVDRLEVSNYFHNDANTGEYRVEEFRFNDGTVWTVDDIKQKALVSSDDAETLIGYATDTALDGAGGDDTIYGRAGDDTLRGSAGDDRLYGEEGADTLSGGAGYDRLSGGDGDDILEGGAGDDWLSGDAGNDVYRFGHGGGHDRIRNYTYQPGETKLDAVQFDSDIASSDVALVRTGNDLRIELNGGTDSVTIDDYFWGDALTGAYRVEELRFGDGSIWTVDDVKQRTLVTGNGDDEVIAYDTDDTLDGAAGDDSIRGRGGNDTLSGGSGADRLYGEEGDDSLDGGAGGDTLQGGNGADTLSGADGDDDLQGGGGDDVLSGGAGNDRLDGGYGSDVYRFGYGSGSDTVDERTYNPASTKVDAVEFDTDVPPSDVTLRRSGNNLVVSLGDGTDRLTVDDYFRNDANSGESRVEELRFSDGTVWDVDHVKQAVLAGTDASETLIGYEVADAIDGEAGDDVIFGRGGDDRLTGGQGDDTLEGGAGSDTYVFHGGHGADEINAFDTTAGRQEEVEFSAAIAPDDIHARRRGDDLLLLNVNGTDQVTIRGHFRDETRNDSTIQAVRFSDGTVWNLSDLNELVLQGSAGDDVLEGHLADDAITGGAGSDTLYGRDGADSLYGDAGADTLYGEVGGDTLIGGAGGDRLEGGQGDDVYEMAAADGADRIFDTQGNDRLRLTDTSSADVVLRRDGGDLVVRLGTGVVLARVLGQFSDEAGVQGGTPLESIEFADGAIWDYDTIKLQAIAGTTGGDVIQGHADADVIQALAGDDTVTAAAGDDEVYGGSGADTLIGGQGGDHLVGGVDGDSLFGNYGEDVLEGGAGDDTLEGGTGDDTLRGGAGVDTLDGGTGVDLLEGGAGGDTLRGNGSLYGGDGGDTLNGTGLLSGGDGDDTLTGLGRDELLGGAGDDELTANGDPWISGMGSFLEGGTGDDTLYGSFADDTYRFGLGDGQDRLIERRAGESYSNVDPSRDTLSFGAGIAVTDLAFERHGDDLVIQHANGADRITIERWFEEPTEHFKVNRFVFEDATELTDSDVEAAVVTYGTASADTLSGYRALDERLYAGAGDDQVWGRAGDDVLHGEAGDDYLDGEAGNDQLIGGIGEDNLQGRDGSDMLDGGADADSLSGGLGEDGLFGRAGADNLFGDEGADYLEGGSGDDYLSGGDADDVLLGGDGNDQLRGDTGDDHLTGGLGDDKYVHGSGQGADTIDNRDGGYDGVFFSDVGADRLNFIRDGDDLLITVDADSTQSVRVLDHFLGGDAAIDYVQPNGGAMLDTRHIADIVAAKGVTGEFATAVVGTGGDDELSAYATDDLLQGLEGDDTLWAFAGADRLEGGSGDDTLYGGDGTGQGSGADQLFGGAGHDILYGEDGDDVLSGGAGSDDYYYSANGGVDVIDNTGGGTDTVFFLGGIDRSRISFHQDGEDLVMLLDGDVAQQVRVTNHFLGGDAAISYVQPTDGGGAIAANEITGLLTAMPDDPADGSGDDGDGGTTNPPPDDGGETPPPAQTGGSDNLVGTTGDDVLLGGADADTLDGQGGNDLLRGGTGDDTYRFGGGQAVLQEDGGNDTLLFTDGIAFSSVSSGLMKSGDDLVLSVDGGPDQVTLSGFFRGGSELVETISFESGGSLTSAQIFGAFGLPVPDGSSPYAGTLVGSNGDDALVQGGSDAERLFGLNGDDSLEGGAGDDLLIGGRGDDTYVFRTGDGQDCIDNTGGGTDQLQFADAGFNDVASGLTKSGDDLVLKVGSGGDQVTVGGFFRGGDLAIDALTFSDGAQLSKSQIFGAFGLADPDPDGSPDYTGLPDERAYGTVQAARSASETILGSSDADLIDGGAGADILNGAQGDDWLIGGRGDDEFIQNRGGGNDSITAYDPKAGKTDVLSFGDDVAHDQLWFQREGDDLSVGIIGTDDGATISGWYLGDAHHVEQIQAADGYTLLDSQVDSLVSAMASFEPPSSGEIVLSPDYQEELQPTISASWQ
ncbi:hypothetical protein KBTX_02242 [wastewater metagenome]|uniref:Cyclic nucleotide-binding domain-containing protein n=2 Tax=unclassified sequences TaxID=12908 RepID=A0A5B8RCS8_9ZZZZ|nr:hypothetical protein KBTEX_02242 [uncultured organism]